MLFVGRLDLNTSGDRSFVDVFGVFVERKLNQKILTRSVFMEFIGGEPNTVAPLLEFGLAHPSYVAIRYCLFLGVVLCHVVL